MWTDERIGFVLKAAAATWPEREYVLFEGRRLTYAELASWVAGTAADLVGRSDRVLAHLPNTLESIVAQLVAVPVITIYREHEMRQIVATAGRWRSPCRRSRPR